MDLPKSEVDLTSENKDSTLRLLKYSSLMMFEDYSEQFSDDTPDLEV